MSDGNGNSNGNGHRHNTLPILIGRGSPERYGCTDYQGLDPNGWWTYACRFPDGRVRFGRSQNWRERVCEHRSRVGYRWTHIGVRAGDHENALREAWRPYLRPGEGDWANDSPEVMRWLELYRIVRLRYPLPLASEEWLRHDENEILVEAALSHMNQAVHLLWLIQDHGDYKNLARALEDAEGAYDWTRETSAAIAEARDDLASDAVSSIVSCITGSSWRA
jgi:hypothetical protein